MFYQYPGVRKGEDVVIAGHEISDRYGNNDMYEAHTFASTNRLIVARMSLWPETSSREFGRYFSTLDLVSYP